MTLVALGAIVYALTNFVKYVRNREWDPALTQLTTWVVGILVVLVAATARIAEGIEIPGTAWLLGDLDFASAVLVGMQASSLFNVVYDVGVKRLRTPTLLRRRA